MSRTRGPAISLASAMAKGFVRDRAALFFAIVFPLMFLVLFGTLFSDSGVSRTDVIEVGDVALLDDASGEAAAVIDDSLELSSSDDLDEALAEVRSGDADAAVAQHGSEVRLWYSAADPVVAGTVQGTFQAIVTSATIAASGQEPEFSLQTEQVEDDDLSTIEYLTPGLLGWAIASAATFAAAITLVEWRTTGLLRKLRLAPISTAPIVTSRVGVSVVIALGQAVIFVAVAMAAVRPDAHRVVVAGDTRAHRRHAGVPGDRPAGRRDREDSGGCRRGREHRRAPDGVPVRARSSRSRAPRAGCRPCPRCCRSRTSTPACST